MPAFSSSAFSTRDQAVSVFRELYEILLADESFVNLVRTQDLSVHFVHSKPDFGLFVDADGVHVDAVPRKPAIAIKMSCDTADALWAGRLLMPIAVATGKIRIKGSVSKVLEFVPMLHPAFDRYPAIAREAGVATAR